MRTRTRMRLYEAADVTAGDARHYAEKAGKWLEKELLVEDSDGVAEAARRLQDALGEHLAKLAKEFSQMEEKEYRERHRADSLRRLREQQLAELSERLVRARGVMSHLYGRAETLRHFGKGKTPRQPHDLIGFAERVVSVLRGKEPLPAKGPRFPGSVLDAEAIARHLEEAAGKLQKTLEELADHECGAGLYLMKKDALGKKLELAQQDVARVLGGLYRLGGYDNLDERVKKNHRKRRPRRRGRVGTADPASVADSRAIASPEEASRAASGQPGSLDQASLAASELPGSADRALVTASKPLASPEEASVAASQALTSPVGASTAACEPVESLEGASSAASQLSASAEGRSPGVFRTLASRLKAAIGSSEELPSPAEAVSGRSARGEPGENAAAVPNAHDTRALHPVRRRRAIGVTASHPVAERGSNGSEPSPQVPEREAHDMAA